MAKSIIKPKASVIWSEQTKKLRQKLSGDTDSDLSFDQGKSNGMQSGLQRNTTKRNIYEGVTKH